MKRSILFCFLLLSLESFGQKFDNLALTPPMGWNSWNTFAVDINEKLVMETADIMASSDLKKAGYIYLVLDDAWMAGTRNAQGDLVPDPVKFPRGMKFISDYVHSKGLKFGLYNCVGTKTCAGYPGTRGYEFQDARFYASQGVDYLKFDWCNSEGINAKEAYALMSKAIRTAGRPMIFSLCEWGTNQPWLWAEKVGHLWRTTGDIGPFFDEKGKIKAHSDNNSVMKNVDLQAGLRKYAGPGHWNDPDMLEVGNGMSPGEDRAHFSLWCMMASPLIMGNDIRKMSPITERILTNAKAIQINQDELGIQGFRENLPDSLEIWIKPLKNKELAVCFLNRTNSPKTLEYNWQEHPIDDLLSKTQVNFKEEVYFLDNIWDNSSKMTTKRVLKTTIPAHDVLFLRLKK